MSKSTASMNYSRNSRMRKRQFVPVNYEETTEITVKEFKCKSCGHKRYFKFYRCEDCGERQE